MAKFNMQQFLLAKGEKIALGLAAGGLGLLAVWGVMNLVSAKSPADVSKAFDSEKSRIGSALKAEGSPVPDLPEYMKDSHKLDLRSIDAENFPVGYTMFEPVDRPSRARDNPKVEHIREAQLDLVRLNMKAFDIKEIGGTTTIGVLKGVQIQGSGVSRQSIQDLFKRSNPRDRMKNQRPPPAAGANPFGGPMGGGLTPPPGSGGTPPPGSGGTPPAGGGFAGMGGGMGGDMMGPRGGMNSGSTYQNKDRYEKTVIHKPIDEFDPAKDEPAFIVYPRRTIVMHAVFPLKAQLELVRKALRLRTIQDAERETSPGGAGTGGGMLTGGMAGPESSGPSKFGGPPPGSGDMPKPGGSGPGPGPGMTTGGATTSTAGVRIPEGPTFAGFEVQRRVTDQQGKVYDWEFYDHVDAYLTVINNRKVADQPDEGYLPYFLRYDQEMAMPLPAVAEGQHTYPPITLPSIVNTVKRMEEARKVPIPLSELQKKFGGRGDSPFRPSFGGAGAGAGFLSSGGGGMSIGGAVTGGSNSPPPPMGGAVGAPPGQPGGTLQQEAKAPIELEHMLIRFIDVKIGPGFSYEYKIRVKMKNPNYNVKNVARPSDAEIPILYGDWTVIAGPDGKTPLRVTVPYDLNTYLVDPVAYRDTLRQKFPDRRVQTLLDNANGRLPVVQVQQWMEQVAIESKTEPLGAWVVGDVPVSRGEFIGKKQLTPLPLWSSQKVAYILQELPRYKVVGAKDQPKGVLVDFTTANICVDYEGGLQSRVVGDRTVEDDGAVEMLIRNADGTLSLKNSGVDATNPERVGRAKQWDEWLEKVKADTAAAGDLGAPPAGGELPGPGGRGGK